MKRFVIHVGNDAMMASDAARIRWYHQWQFVRLVSRRWWNFGNNHFDPKAQMARRQASVAASCLLARNSNERDGKIDPSSYGVFSIGVAGVDLSWHCNRPGKHLKPRLP